MRSPSVSIVIPAYNEEGQLALCLDSIARQTVKPLEVIVVDNNSTDGTVEVARRYPFVTVLSEWRQGVVHARDCGFDAARGDIIGRIDAETVMAPDWIQKVQGVFAKSDIDAISGSIGFTDVPFEPIFAGIELFFRTYLARNLGRRNELFLYGGNMAMRRQAWHDIKGQLCDDRAFHEDQDMAAHFAHTSYNLAFDKNLRARISARRIDTPLNHYYPYVVANSRTYAAHGLRGRFYMYPIEFLVVVFYPLLRILYRAHDPATGKLSFKCVLRAEASVRISPVSENI